MPRGPGSYVGRTKWGVGGGVGGLLNTIQYGYLYFYCWRWGGGGAGVVEVVALKYVDKCLPGKNETFECPCLTRVSCWVMSQSCRQEVNKGNPYYPNNAGNILIMQG